MPILTPLGKGFRLLQTWFDQIVVVIITTTFVIMCPSLDHPDLSSLDERLFTKNFDAKARLTEISVNDMIGLKNINVSMTTNHRDKKFT